jgi:hypothetical protein
MDHPDIAYLVRYAHACCCPFGAAEQRSRWWNKTSNLSERQRAFDVPPLASKGILMDNRVMIIANRYSFTGRT